MASAEGARPLVAGVAWRHHAAVTLACASADLDAFLRDAAPPPCRRLVALDRVHRPALMRSAADHAIREATGERAADAAVWADAIIDGARSGRRAGDRFDFAVLDARAAVVGVAGVRFTGPRADVGELGYWIDAADRGRGHATAASRRLARFAFEALGARQVVARVQPDNLASRRVLAKLGFRPLDGDGSLYTLARDELHAPAPAEGETMLLIRPAQLDVFRASVDRRFVQGAIARLVDAFPAAFEAPAPPELEAAALAALARARAHGLTTDRDLTAFVEIALLVSPSFDEHPAFAAALRDPRIAPDERMSALLATISEDVWEEAAQQR